MAIDTWVENFSGAVLQALAASTPKYRQCDDPWPPIPPEEPAADAVGGHQGARSESRGQPPVAVCDPQFQ